MLKYTAASIAPSVTKLFNLSIRIGRIPNKWKESMITPIPKSSHNSSDPGDYRPISLTCILCKLLEKHICDLMYEHACRMATRSWESSYQDLLNCVDLSSLEYRRLETRLCTLYKIIYNLCYFENGIFTLNTTLSHRAHHNLVLNRPFARTNLFICASYNFYLEFFSCLCITFLI